MKKETKLVESGDVATVNAAIKEAELNNVAKERVQEARNIEVRCQKRLDMMNAARAAIEQATESELQSKLNEAAALLPRKDPTIQTATKKLKALLDKQKRDTKTQLAVDKAVDKQKAKARIKEAKTSISSPPRVAAKQTEGVHSCAAPDVDYTTYIQPFELSTAEELD